MSEKSVGSLSSASQVISLGTVEMASVSRWYYTIVLVVSALGIFLEALAVGVSKSIDPGIKLVNVAYISTKMSQCFSKRVVVFKINSVLYEVLIGTLTVQAQSSNFPWQYVLAFSLAPKHWFPS